MVPPEIKIPLIIFAVAVGVIYRVYRGKKGGA